MAESNVIDFSARFNKSQGDSSTLMIDSEKTAEKSKFCREVIDLLARYESEAGYFHPAERLMSSQEYRLFVKDALQEVYKYIHGKSDLTVNFLRCIYSVFDREPWNEIMLIGAITNPDVSVREVVVEAIEHWGLNGDAKKILVIAIEREDVPWLREYMQNVLDGH